MVRHHQNRTPALPARTLAAAGVTALLVTGASGYLVFPSKATASDHGTSGTQGSVLSAPPTTPPAALAILGARTPTATPHSSGTRQRPNIVMVTTDDESETDLRYMPNLRRLVERTGVSFADSLAPTPMCVPARASLLSGQYASNHGAYTISGPHGGFAAFGEHRTLPTWLQAAGYDTYFAGKYLNGYGRAGTAMYRPPGWNTWQATVDPSTYDFMHPIVNDNGRRLLAYHEYNSRLIGQLSRRWITRHAHESRPFFMWVNYTAPHFGGPEEPGSPAAQFRGTSAGLPTTVPDPADAGRYAGVPIPPTPDLFMTHTAANPQGSPTQHRFTGRQKQMLRRAYDLRIEAVRGVDRQLGATIADLKRTGRWQHTVFVFTSDNGFAVGQHNIYGKLWQYNEITHIPVLITGPGVPHRRVSTPLTNADIPVTLAALAGARPTRHVDGVDLMPWLTARPQARVVPMESWPVDDGAHRPVMSGVRFGPWDYAIDHQGIELYNRAVDPYEVHNLARVPAYRQVRRALGSLRRRYVGCVARACPRAEYPAAPMWTRARALARAAAGERPPVIASLTQHRRTHRHP